jgi:solute carrier family 41
VIIVLFVVVIPFLVIYARKNEFVKETLYHGWLPILLAMIISSMAGVLLEKAIEVFYGIAIYQPVVNGIGGNLVGIFASRLSTALHSRDKFGEWASWAPAKWYLYPLETFFGKQNPEWKTSLILTALILPGHLVFFFTIYAFTDKSERHDLSAVLVLGYLFITFFQVFYFIFFYFDHMIWF